MSYDFFWAIPRRLYFICQRFGTLFLFHLRRWVGMKCDWGWECGVLYVEIFVWSQTFPRTIPHTLNCSHTSYLLAHEDGTDRGLRLFLGPNFFTYNTPHSHPQSHFIHTHLRRWNRQSVPKRWHIKYRRRGITKKKSYDIFSFSNACTLSRPALGLALGTLPEDGNVMPKHVGTTIHNY
jgi:hypothetical protein